jgi:hypothetical protein
MKKVMNSLCTYLQASAVRKIRELLLLNRLLIEGIRGNAEQHRKSQTWNWDGNKTHVHLTYLHFLASKD